VAVSKAVCAQRRRGLCWWIRMMKGQPLVATVGVDFGPWKPVRLYVRRGSACQNVKHGVIVIDQIGSFFFVLNFCVIKRRFSGH